MQSAGDGEGAEGVVAEFVAHAQHTGQRRAAVPPQGRVPCRGVGRIEHGEPFLPSWRVTGDGGMGHHGRAGVGNQDGDAPVRPGLRGDRGDRQAVGFVIRRTRSGGDQMEHGPPGELLQHRFHRVALDARDAAADGHHVFRVVAFAHRDAKGVDMGFPGQRTRRQLDEVLALGQGAGGQMEVVAAAHGAVPAREGGADIGADHAMMRVTQQHSIQGHVDARHAVARQGPAFDHHAAGDGIDGGAIAGDGHVEFEPERRDGRIGHRDGEVFFPARRADGEDTDLMRSAGQAGDGFLEQETGADRHAGVLGRDIRTRLSVFRVPFRASVHLDPDAPDARGAGGPSLDPQHVGRDERRLIADQGDFLTVSPGRDGCIRRLLVPAARLPLRRPGGRESGLRERGGRESGSSGIRHGRY